MHNLLPPPSLQPLSRLHVTDGLLLNADRWQHAHNYHRQRQNLHYQSLHQPGIVWGLGVSVIAAPIDTAAPYRDARWVQIQPGIAIDLLGNPIVVDQPISFRVASEAIDQPVIVYLVIRYVDPTTLHRATPQDIVQETFRIDEKTTAPNGTDVELCRIFLQPGTVALRNATDVLAPTPNQINLCYRSTVQTRTQGTVRVTQLKADQNSQLTSRLSRLLRSLPALYPTLQGFEPIDAIDPNTDLDNRSSNNYDLIYLTYTQLGELTADLTETRLITLRQQMQAGSLVVIELSDPLITELTTIKCELQDAIEEFSGAEIQTALETELTACDTDLQQYLITILIPLQRLLPGLSVQEVSPIAPDHPLRTRPFLFSRLPSVGQDTVQVLNWGGLVLILGELSAAWGYSIEFDRETVRSAQELGINLLHYAWRRHTLTQLQLEQIM